MTSIGYFVRYAAKVPLTKDGSVPTTQYRVDVFLQSANGSVLTDFFDRA
jgi:hypothetical protein